MQDITIRKRKVTGYAKRQDKKQTRPRHIIIFLIVVTILLIIVNLIGSHALRYDNGAVWVHRTATVSVKMVRQSEVDTKEVLSAMYPKKEVKKAYYDPNYSKLTKAQKMVLKGQNFVPPPSDLKPLIDKAAIKHGVDKYLMKAISYCESDYRAKAKNVNKNGTSDSGVAQLNDIHLPELKKLGLDRNNPAHAYEFMAILMKRNGTRDYKASQICWEEAVKVASLTK